MARAAASKAETSAALDFQPTGEERLCILHGPDDLLRRDALRRLRAALGERHGQVEEIRLEAQRPTELGPAAVLDELRGFSFFTSYKLVVLDLHADKAGNLPWLAREGGHRDAIERYAAQPVEHATLVIRAPVWKPGTLDRLAAKVGAVVDCAHPDPRGAVAWLEARAKALHAALEANAARAMVERMGCDLLALESELERLALLAGDKPVTRALVEAETGQVSEEKAWAIQDEALRAVATGSAEGAFLKLHEIVALTDAGEDALIPLLIALVQLAQALSVGSRMVKAGTPAADAAKALKFGWGERLRLFTDALRAGSPAAFAGLLEEALKLEARAKGGGLTDPRRAAEALLVRMAGMKGGGR